MAATPSHQALYRRFRAQRFVDVVGQEAVVATLRNAVRTAHVGHAYLFVGPRGTGKTTLARILAKAINCPNVIEGEPCDACPTCDSIRLGTTLDLTEIDAASNRGINDVRDLRERVQYPPTEMRRKVYILDEAHQITKDGWNALLKTLEEPPDFVTFVFASTEPSGFPAAVMSRLQRFDLKPLTVPQIEGKLRRILAAEDRAADTDAISLVSRLANGGMRDAESILDQLLSAGAPNLTAEAVRDLLGLADSVSVEGFLVALARGDAGAGLAALDAVEDQGRDLRSFTDQVIDALRDALRVALVGGLESTGGLASLGIPALAGVARRMAGVDPQSSAPGGIRFQLELALLAPVPVPAPAPPAPAPAAAAAPTGAKPAVEPAKPVVTLPLPGEIPDPVAPLPSGAPDPVPYSAPAPPPRVTPSALAGDLPSEPDWMRDEQPELVGATPVVRAAPDPVPVAAPVLAPPVSAPPPPVSAPPPPVSAPPPPVSAPPPPVSAPPPPVSAPPPPVSAPPPAPADDALGALKARWPEVVALISRHPPTKPVVEACRPVAVDGSSVTLGFPETQAFLRDVADRRKAILEAGLSRILGRPIAVRIVATNLDAGTRMDSDPGGARMVEIARSVFGADLIEPPPVE